MGSRHLHRSVWVPVYMYLYDSNIVISTLVNEMEVFKLDTILPVSSLNWRIRVGAAPFESSLNWRIRVVLLLRGKYRPEARSTRAGVPQNPRFFCCKNCTFTEGKIPTHQNGARGRRRDAPPFFLGKPGAPVQGVPQNLVFLL